MRKEGYTRKGDFQIAQALGAAISILPSGVWKPPFLVNLYRQRFLVQTGLH